MRKQVNRTFYPSKARDGNRQIAHLYADPLISYAGSVGISPLGFVMDTGGALKDRECWFLVTSTWSILNSARLRQIRQAAIWHRTQYPKHKFVFLCNSQQEFELMLSLGEAAVFHTKTASVSESIFRPLPNANKKFDAIYNAQMRSWKRHTLSMEIENCAYAYYRASAEQRWVDEERSIIDLLTCASPGHKILNAYDDNNRPIRFLPDQINEILNTAHVGLCLSKVEGAMLASVEYMLAGLPVVSTPSQGGRDVFFDDEFCIIADDNPRAVAQAVAALKAKNIPSEYVRTQTLKKLEVHRHRLLTLINQILEESGADERITMTWPFTHTPAASWKPASQALDDALAFKVHDFGQVGAFHKVD